jgi:hypothetical protein
MPSNTISRRAAHCPGALLHNRGANRTKPPGTRHDSPGRHVPRLIRADHADERRWSNAPQDETDPHCTSPAREDGRADWTACERGFADDGSPPSRNPDRGEFRPAVRSGPGLAARLPAARSRRQASVDHQGLPREIGRGIAREVGDHPGANQGKLVSIGSSPRPASVCLPAATQRPPLPTPASRT